MQARRARGIRLAVGVVAFASSTIVATPFAFVPAAVAAPPGFVTAGGDALLLDGAPFTFTGINVYNANNTGGCWNALSDTVLGQSFDAIGGERVVRAWFFQSLATSGGVRDWTSFDRSLAFAAARGMKVIPTLGNQWGACDGPSGGPGDDKDEAWYTSGYATAISPGSVVSYRNWVAEIVGRYASDPTILAWQLMNEAEVKPVVGDGLPCSTNAATILRDFAANVSTLVKSIDPHHLLSLGTIGGGQCGTSFEEYEFVHDMATIDVCEYHDYGAPNTAFPGDEFNGLAKRVAQCDSLNKPLIIGESGIRPTDADGTFTGRASAFRAKLEAQLAAGIDGVMLWAWNPAGSTLDNYDIGPGDPALAVLADVLMPPFTAELVTGGGFSDGVATEIGLNPRDIAWDAAGDRLLVADCEVLRAIDPVARTSTVVAIAADLPNPTNVATFLGRVYEVAARGDGVVLLGLEDATGCTELYWDRVARLNTTGAATPIAGDGATPAAAGVPAADADWDALRDLVTSHDGSIIVVTSQGVVHEFEPGGLISMPLGGASSNVQIALSPSGDLFSSDGAQLSAIDPAGVDRLITDQLSLPSFPLAVTYGGDGGVWLVGGTRVVRVDVTTGTIEEIGDVGDVGGSESSYWATIATSTDGRAYTTSGATGIWGRVIAVSSGSPVTVLAGTTDRWQGEARPADRQQFGLLAYQVMHGRAEVAADASHDLHVFGSRLATIDGATGLTSTDPDPTAFWIGQRSNGDDVLSMPSVPGEFSPRRLVLRDDVTGLLTPLLPDPLDPASESFIDVAPDGTVSVASFSGATGLTTITVDGTVTTEPIGDRPNDEFGNPAGAFTVWATATGLFAHLTTGLVRRVGGDWVDVGTCSGGDGPFSPLVALRDGRFLGTVAVGPGFRWCRVDPSTGAATLFPGEVDFPIPSNAHESDDGFVYFEGSDSGGVRLGVYRMRVGEAAPAAATITLALATDPAGAADVFTAAGAIAGTISHGQQLTAVGSAGTSAVTVSGPSGWASTGVVCDDTDSSAGAVSGQVVFRTAPGDTVRCTVVMARTVLAVTLADGTLDEGTGQVLRPEVTGATGAVITAWDVGDNGTIDGTGVTIDLAAADGPSTIPVRVTVTDSTGARATALATYIVRNVAPTAGVLVAPAEVVVNRMFTVTVGPIADVSGDSLTVAFDCGTGGFAGASSSVTGSCRAPRTAGPITVRARVDDGDGGITVVTTTVSIVVAAVPGAPSALVTVSGLRSATITWTAAVDNGSPVLDNQIQRSTDDATTWSVVNDGVSPATSATISLLSGTGYLVRVRAKNLVGWGPWSLPVVARAWQVPSAPTGVIAVAGVGSMLVRWSAPNTDGGSPVTGYVIERSTDLGVSWSRTSVTATETVITGLRAGTAYLVRVVAVNSVGRSAPSDAVVVTTPAVPAAPLDVSATPGLRSVTLSWSAPFDGMSPITDYVIQRSANGGVSWSTVADGASTSTTLTVTGLTTGRVYSFRVRAVNAVGSGAWSTTVTARAN